MLGKEIDQDDVRYYRLGQYPSNNSEKYYGGIEFSDNEHHFLFQHVGQKNIIDLYALVYKYFVEEKGSQQLKVSDNSSVNEEIKKIFIDNLPSDTLIPNDKWDMLIKVASKIKRGIIDDNSLRKFVREYAEDAKAKKILDDNDVRNKLMQEIENGSGWRDLNEHDRSSFVRQFIVNNIVLEDLSSGERAALFRAVHDLFLEVINTVNF